jgi:type IV pilus assembly protein PilM
VHEIDARSRRSGAAIPFDETLMSTVNLPKRDREQMQKIIPAEARRFIPVPIEEVMLDWYAIPDDQADAFDTMQAGKITEAQFQKVMVVGVNKKTARSFTEAIARSGFSCEFFEIEIFSAIHASLHAQKEPTLLLDLGASATKAAIVNQHWVLVAARMIPVGGAQITGDIAKALAVDFDSAERLKCEQGLLAASSCAKPIAASLQTLFTYINQVLEEHAKQSQQAVKHVLLSGGGAYMPGIVEYIKTKLPYSVEILNGFQRARGPMILAEAIALDGPRYAVAAGLALRGVGK